ncbi:Phage endolysin [Pseudomonas sp. OF001]|uniref:M15 family metallopeptidase n=1 Tax=Pseudomonas sp. OF001 TaxID=2772300 RepID=UPI00191B6272|nr:M15 family metallopeptidase [Pseudomonas sp. OF001]CAD5377376.1 Phage endolysin [Pseudomonas sp. OF001]
MPFSLGSRSLQNLDGVHPDLQRVVKLAITMTDTDFTVLEGLRSKERQRQLVANGASKTMDGRHLTGHAVDLGAWVDGKVSWDWEHYYRLAEAMKRAAKLLNVPIVWGGVWDKSLNSLGDTKAAVDAYVASRRRLGRQAFIDGPHFELRREDYPA